MAMKLCSWDISPYAARVRMQIYAKGITDIATEQTPFFLTQKFYGERPLSRIPSLEIDGDAVPESAVIAEYLEEVYPELSLLRPDALALRHRQHCRAAQRPTCEQHQDLGPHDRPRRLCLPRPPDPGRLRARAGAFRRAVHAVEQGTRRPDRREQISTGEREKMRAANQAAKEAAERTPRA